MNDINPIDIAVPVSLAVGMYAGYWLTTRQWIPRYRGLYERSRGVVEDVSRRLLDVAFKLGEQLPAADNEARFNAVRKVLEDNGFTMIKDGGNFHVRIDKIDQSGKAGSDRGTN